MPQEDRRIIFTNDEVYKAIYAMCHKQGIKKPPPGALQSIQISDDHIDTINIHIGNPQNTDSTTQIFDYKRDFIAAALMLFCRGCGIPLPKSAKKSVLLENNILILRVQI